MYGTKTMSDKNKKSKLKKVIPKKYRIYGIFDFKSEKLIDVSMDKEELELKFDIDGLDDNQFGVVLFDVILT